MSLRVASDATVRASELSPYIPGLARPIHTDEGLSPMLAG